MHNAIVPHWAGSALGGLRTARCEVHSAALSNRDRTGKASRCPRKDTARSGTARGAWHALPPSTVRSPSSLVPTVLSNRREWAQPVVVVKKAGALLRRAWTSVGAGEVGPPAGTI